jgi:hypothetical protein
LGKHVGQSASGGLVYNTPYPLLDSRKFYYTRRGWLCRSGVEVEELGGQKRFDSNLNIQLMDCDEYSVIPFAIRPIPLS